MKTRNNELRARYNLTQEELENDELIRVAESLCDFVFLI